MTWRTVWQLARDSVALRLTLYASMLAVITSMLFLAIFYTQTAFVLETQFSRQVSATAQRLIAHFEQGGRDALIQEIALELTDQVNAETEILVLLDENDRLLAGNAADWPLADLSETTDEIQHVMLRGQMADVYTVTRRLADGARLIVGQDIRDLQQMTRQLSRLLPWAWLFILLVTLTGSFLFRHALQQRVAVIRKTAAQVSAGRLKERVPVSRVQDEFALLTHDINQMLERIDHLMTGVRHVSDSVAHNLRTPIARILLSLRPVLRADSSATELRQAAEFAATQLQELGQLLEKLLHIADLESGMRRTAFSAVDLGAVARDVVDLYSALAEAAGATVTLEAPNGVLVQGDADLLASAVANLIDNALKYAQPNAVVHITLRENAARATLTVADNGPGIAPDKRARIGQRFYRAGHAGAGYGLGLASVIAIVKLHDGEFRILPATQGTVIALEFPRL